MMSIFITPVGSFFAVYTQIDNKVDTVFRNLPFLGNTVGEENFKDQSILRDNIQQKIVKHSILSDDNQTKITSIKATDSFDKGCMSFTNNIKGDTTIISVQKSRTKRKLTPEQEKDKPESRKECKRISRQNSKLKHCNIEIKVVPQQRYRKSEKAKSIQFRSETGENTQSLI